MCIIFVNTEQFFCDTVSVLCLPYLMKVTHSISRYCMAPLSSDCWWYDEQHYSCFFGLIIRVIHY